jgi:hypothetical protein
MAKVVSVENLAVRLCQCLVFTESRSGMRMSPGSEEPKGKHFFEVSDLVWFANWYQDMIENSIGPGQKSQSRILNE